MEAYDTDTQQSFPHSNWIEKLSVFVFVVDIVKAVGLISTRFSMGVFLAKWRRFVTCSAAPYEGVEIAIGIVTTPDVMKYTDLIYITCAGRQQQQLSLQLINWNE